MGLSIIFLKQNKNVYWNYYFKLSERTVITHSVLMLYMDHLALEVLYTLNFTAWPANDWCWVRRHQIVVWIGSGNSSYCLNSSLWLEEPSLHGRTIFNRLWYLYYSMLYWRKFLFCTGLQKQRILLHFLPLTFYI